MGGDNDTREALRHFTASGIAAVVNFPLWRAAAIGQSGFVLEGSNVLVRYWKAVMPGTMPYRGVSATMLGMTWARGAIFFGSQKGKQMLKDNGYDANTAQLLPPLVISTFVQFANMPLVRATVTLQDPKNTLPNVREAIKFIYNRKGISGLWHGVSAGVLKTVPKYIVAVCVKDFLEDTLPPADPNDKYAVMNRSGVKSCAAGLAGAILTNPLDVLRNEMFKTDLGLSETYRKLMREEGWAFMARGMASNCTAVAIPIAVTIFMTDMLKNVM
jgi:hypothetical protein